jgi:hypothetical protein
MTARRSVIVQMDGFFLHLSEEFSRGLLISTNYLSALPAGVEARCNQREVEVVLGNTVAFTGFLQLVGFADEVDG